MSLIKLSINLGPDGRRVGIETSPQEAAKIVIAMSCCSIISLGDIMDQQWHIFTPYY